MPTISLCMIVRDEAAVLERCLQSVAHLVDEIIIVDTGSVDETKTIAAAFTPHLYDFPLQMIQINPNVQPHIVYKQTPPFLSTHLLA